MPMACTPRRSLFVCLLPLAAALPAHADEADVINFRASVNLLHDDNLFRASRNAQADTIATTIAGVDFNKRISLQQLVGQVSWVDTRYGKNDYLNAGNLHYNGRWLWAVGSNLTGEVAASRAAVQNFFSDFPGLRQRNIRTTESQRFALDYAVHPSWHVTGGVSRMTVSNDQLLPQESDFEANSVLMGLRHTPKSGNWLGFQTRHTEGRYTKRPFSAASQFDNEFKETGQEFTVGWEPTGHSAFNGRLEFVQRRHANFSSRDFSGVTGQLGYQYRYSAKTLLTATYLRGINAFQDILGSSSYYVADDLVLGSRWDATAKISVSTRFGYSQRRYQGQLPGFAGPTREDDLYRMGVDLSYQAYRWLELKGGLSAERRNSSFSGLDYTNRQLLLSAIARF